MNAVRATLLMSVCLYPLLAYAQGNFQLITVPAWFDVNQAKIFIGGDSAEDAYGFDIENTYIQLNEGNGKMVCGPIIDEPPSKAMYCAEPAIIVSAKQALDAHRGTIAKTKNTELRELPSETKSAVTATPAPDKPTAGF